jgi:hypothetical protein
MDSSTLIIAIFYIAIGLVGVLLNGTTVFMIVSQRVFVL